MIQPIASEYSGVKGQIFPIDNALRNFKTPYLGNRASEAKKDRNLGPVGLWYTPHALLMTVLYRYVGMPEKKLILSPVEGHHFKKKLYCPPSAALLIYKFNLKKIVKKFN